MPRKPVLDYDTIRKLSSDHTVPCIARQMGYKRTSVHNALTRMGVKPIADSWRRYNDNLACPAGCKRVRKRSLDHDVVLKLALEHTKSCIVRQTGYAERAVRHVIESNNMQGEGSIHRRQCKAGCEPVAPAPRQENGALCECGCGKRLPRGSTHTIMLAHRKCEGCGGRLSRESKTGYCSQNPECRGKANSVNADPQRQCQNCGGVISKMNKSGYCRKNDECAKLCHQFNDDKRPRRLKPNRDLPTFIPAAKTGSFILPEDGIVDEQAIKFAVYNIRPVALTPREREIVLDRLLAHGNYYMDDMRKRMHVGFPQLKNMLRARGWEVVQDPLGESVSRKMVARMDRPTDKLLGTSAANVPLERPFAEQQGRKTRLTPSDK